MSSGTSRATTSAGGWQSQANKNTNLNPSSYRPNSSPPLGSKGRQKQAITSQPVQEVEGHIANTTAFTQEVFDPDTLLDGFDTHANTDIPSQFLYGNYLTPDHGSENPFSEQSSYTSPSIDEFLWQESFNPSHDFDDAVLVNNLVGGLDTANDLQGIVPAKIPLTTADQRSATPRPQPTSTSPAGQMPSLQPDFSASHSLSDGMNQSNGKRARSVHNEGSEEVDRSSRLVANESQDNRQSMMHIVKPTVTISSYNRGDSPARTAMPMARSLSKRSQSSRLSEQAESSAILTVEPAAISPTSRLMPPDQYDSGEWEEDDDEEVATTARGGVAPRQRNDDTIPSLKDLEQQREIEETRVGVENWLATSDTTGAEIGRRGSRSRNRRERIRSRSTGARTDPHGALPISDQHVPGPGVLLDVESDNDYSDDGSSQASSDDKTEKDPASPAANVHAFDPADAGYFPPIEEDIAPDDPEPLPGQFIRRGPWKDPAQFTQLSDTEQIQPQTSNHAIVRWDQQAAKFETASRAATWGTRRRLSDSEIASIVDGSKVRHMSLSSKARDRGTSFINRARTVIRRSSSTIKKNKEQLSRQPSPSDSAEKMTVLEHDHTYPTSPIQQLQRTFSWGRSKSPPSKSPPMTATGGALMAMTGQLTAVSGRTAATGVEPLERPKSPFLSALKRSRSKSDLPKPMKSTPGLSDLMKGHGGPPIPTLASPMHLRRDSAEHKAAAPVSVNDDDDMDEDNEEEIPVKMELAVQSHNIIPNLDGFRTHARQLNPRLEAYLVERIAQDQLRRYKKLVKIKIEHTANVQHKGHCASGPFCMDLGGESKALPIRTSAKDASVNYPQFKIGHGGDSEGEDGPFVEGIVTPALFPSGIPLPPTKRLPAEFECPLCFQVKKFQKPSDWTKHVHEDVQPFSCTFPNCPEPKSFKRKADWVRHENERHRHLEWWRCNVQECAHMCYRKDNFVQHLVREHKMTEPKSKGQRPAGTRARPMGRAAQTVGQDPDDFWHLVQHCRHDTSLTPRNEPCKFCGNICSTWKKLSVHVGKHMEQIAMPVVELVAKRNVTADTIISPIDPPNGRMAHNTGLDTTSLNAGLSGNNFDALSPYSASAVSGYQNSSAGQSPVPMHASHSHSSSTSNVYYEPVMMPNGVQQIPNNMQQFSGTSNVPQHYPYQSYEVVNGHNYIAMNHPVNAFTQQPVTPSMTATYHSPQLPRSQPMEGGFGGLNVDTMHASMYSHENYYPNSAPGNSYGVGFGNNMIHPNGSNNLHNEQAMHMQGSGPTTQPGSSEFMYAHHPGPNGGHYYQ